MKNYFFPTILLLLIVTSFSSCTKDDDTPSNSTANIEMGSWRITLFNDSGSDELSHYTGYSFTFSAGVVTAVKGGTIITGTYSKIRDSGKDKLIFNFGVVVPFKELNDDWEILENTSAKLRLQHISGGGSGTDLLTFEKN